MGDVLLVIVLALLAVGGVIYFDRRPWPRCHKHPK